MTLQSDQSKHLADEPQDNPQPIPEESALDVQSAPESDDVAFAEDRPQFGRWWAMGLPEQRADLNLTLLGMWVRDLTHSTLWFSWTLEQRLLALNLLIKSCGGAPHSTFGILPGVSAEEQHQMKQFFGNLFAPVGSEELPLAWVQSLLDEQGIAVRADEALFFNPPRAWELFPEELLTQEFLSSLKCGHA